MFWKQPRPHLRDRWAIIAVLPLLVLFDAYWEPLSLPGIWTSSVPQVLDFVSWAHHQACLASVGMRGKFPWVILCLVRFKPRVTFGIWGLNSEKEVFCCFSLGLEEGESRENKGKRVTVFLGWWGVEQRGQSLFSVQGMVSPKRQLSRYDMVVRHIFSKFH
jgi:hypothetical protein